MNLEKCRTCQKYQTHKVSGSYGIVVCTYFGNVANERPLWRSVKDGIYRVNCPTGEW